jgi:hypothetical protein
MSDPCIEIERIVKTEAILGEVKEAVNKHGEKLDILIDAVGTQKNNKGFIGGIAATGWLVGTLTCDMIKPFIKPLAAAIIATIR